jgi:asparagine synthase (glutamine-hydrolysing)
MGLFFLARADAKASRVAAALGVATQMGFPPPTVLRTEAADVYLFPKRGQNAASVVTFPNGDFVAACGTFVYRAQVGEAGLRRFYEDFSGDFSILHEAICHFAIIIWKDRRLQVSADPVGVYHIFRDELAGVVSSSFLVAAATIDRLTLATQGIYEYVFNGVISGNDTLIDELTLVPIGASLTLTAGEARLEQPRLEAPQAALPATRQELMDKSFAELDRLFGALAGCFGDRISCSLSGGYDSRLILGMLRRCGTRPRVFVYGRPDDPDVAIASSIARGEGFHLEVIDKEQHNVRAPDDFEETAARNFLASDGYTWGGIFNNGAEQQERANRVAGGAISLNGGGGEIFRNFFYLLDGCYTPRQLLWSFYAQFDPATCTQRFAASRYFRELERKLIELVGTIPRLERPTVEWLYHRFRCRSWDGRIDTINGQFGYTGLPFLSVRISDLAARIPIRWKHHGSFEAELIRTVDKRLAAYGSTHGHNFAESPPWRSRVSDFGTYLRPTSLRRLSYRVQNRLPRRLPWTGYLEPSYVEAALPGGRDALREFFHLERLNDPQQLARVLSLEYFVRHFGGRCRFDN